MLIDCDTCVAQDVGCSDCVVALLLQAPDASPDLDVHEARAFAALAEGGLAPPLRLVPIRQRRTVRPDGVDPSGLTARTRPA